MWSEERMRRFVARRTDPSFRCHDAWERAWLARWMEPIRGGTILDAPCGDGRLFATWSELGASVVAVDANGEMCRRAAAEALRLRLPVWILERDLRSGRLPEGDGVACVRLMCHVERADADRLLVLLIAAAPRVALQFNEDDGGVEAKALHAAGSHRLDRTERLRHVAARHGAQLVAVESGPDGSTSRLALFLRSPTDEGHHP